MKARTLIFSGLICAVVLFAGYGYGSASSGVDTLGSKIGIVSVRGVFAKCKANEAYKAKAVAEQKQRSADLEVLQKKIAAQEAGLNALKMGSSDYMKQYEQLLGKQAQFEATKQFNSQQRVLQDRRWTEDLYKEVLRISKELARAKNLAIVLEVDEPEFPMRNTDELMMALQTHKILFSEGCVDMTVEVTAEMDKIQSKFNL